MNFPRVPWLLDSEPREVQLEALSRSYYGYKSRNARDQEEKPVQFREAAPAKGWGHMLEMRLGKTLILLNEFLMFRRDFGVKRLIVFSPNSYKDDWVAEATKYGVDVPFMAYETSRYKDSVAFVNQASKDGFGLVINYEALQYSQTQELLSSLVDKLTMVGADESIKIKNPQSITTKQALALTKEAGVTRAQTGLPMTQGPQDLYSQLRFIRAMDGKNFFSYRNRYCKMGGFKNKKVVGAKNEDELKETLETTMMIAKRRDWGRYNKPEYYPINLGMADVQKKHYVEMDREFITLLENGEEVTVDQVISKLLKLQQISSGFLYTEQGKAVELMDPRKTPKMLKLIEMLEEEIPGKLIVVYHYGKSGDTLMEVLKDYDPCVIRSSMWMKKNGRNVIEEKARFNSSGRVMVLQESAGKYGHDLSGNKNSRTQFMAFYENTYSLDDRSQVEMRPTSYEQDWTSVYLDFISSKVERDAVKALVAKENLVAAIIGSYHEGGVLRRA